MHIQSYLKSYGKIYKWELIKKLCLHKRFLNLKTDGSRYDNHFLYRDPEAFMNKGLLNSKLSEKKQ